MAKLGVNISHVATIRQAWGGTEPDPVWAAAQAELGGADSITVHLRTDRGHIKDRDVRLLRDSLQAKYNLEMAPTSEMLAVAGDIRPDQVTLVSEPSHHLRPEGGLDVSANRIRIAEYIARLRDLGVEVTLFIDPELRQIEAGTLLGVDGVELFAGRYVDAVGRRATELEFHVLAEAAAAVRARAMNLFIGHGLNYTNTPRLTSIPGVDQFNVGHSIVSKALFVGLAEAVREMKRIVL